MANVKKKVVKTKMVAKEKKVTNVASVTVPVTNGYHGYHSSDYEEEDWDEPPSVAGLSVTDDNHAATNGKESISNGPSKVVRESKSSRGSARGATSMSKGPPVNLLPIDPKTTLFFEAIREGAVAKVKTMLRSKNMNLNTRDLNDPLAPTALIVACETDSTEIVKLLLTMKKAKHLDVNQENKRGRRPIWISALKGNAEIADMLLNVRGTECDVNFTDPDSGTTPLYRAILSKSVAVVKLLIDAKADVNMRKMGLGIKAEPPLIKAVQLDNLDIVKLLINALCKIQATTEDGFNALFFAVAYRRYQIAEFLLENNIKIHAKSNTGITAMTVAIEHHNPAMVKMLIEWGYKLDKRYKWKETPLSQAINLHSEECAMTLIQQGCNLSKKRGDSYFYMAVDEKLTRLTKFMVAVNPHYLQESWVREKRWPVSIYHRPDIITWLDRESEKVRTLRQLCRGRIFRILGKYAPHKLTKLNLPANIREYVSYNSHVKPEFFVQTPLSLVGECPVECPAICTRKYCPPIEFSSSSESDNSIDDDDVDDHDRHHHQCSKSRDNKDNGEKCCDYCK